MHTSEQLLRAKGPVQLEFENLGLKLSKGAVVLAGVSGKFEPRKLIAIMGPSGAGKSTFLNVLCGKASSYGKMTGVLKVNGREVKSVNQVPGKRNMGFVPQDDIVHEDLTVCARNLRFNFLL
jgi:ABC-type multidrug transport system ATPase subunit